LNQSPIKDGKPFSKERTREIIRDFKRDGFVLIPNVLEKDEVKAVCEKTDELFDDPKTIQNGYLRENHFIVWHLNELDRIFCDLLVREPIFSLMEAIFGPGCQQCGNQVLRNDHTQAIDHWHVDNDLFFSLPDDVPRYDPRIDIPIMWLTVQIALTDIDSIECGPSQYVPGSHYSGRHPPKTDAPTFEGRGPVSALCKAGDIYLHNPQCWHRGTPNRSGRFRYLLQQQYGPAWAFRRYNAYIQHKMPEHLLEGASRRLLEVHGDLRFHPEERYTGTGRK
jgi:ectoine hydroxylase-related dioxygenase (phytanoyl-CoA dioxygenase family)